MQTITSSSGTDVLVFQGIWEMSVLRGFRGFSSVSVSVCTKAQTKRVGGKETFNVPLLGDTISMDGWM